MYGLAPSSPTSVVALKPMLGLMKPAHTYGALFSPEMNVDCGQRTTIQRSCGPS
jgi:hypothetical protein